MNATQTSPLISAFSTVRDPRRPGRTLGHSLVNIISIAICAIIGGANDWVSVCFFAENRKDWFAKFLDMENGIPSHDTFCRVMALINPVEFEASFQNWVSSICGMLKIPHIAIDGKALRGSANKTKGIECIKLVSAFATEAKITLGQTDVEEGSNEIIAIPKLLEMLEISGAIITIDAIACQEKIVDQIVEQDADYIIAVKNNQPTLMDAIKEEFTEFQEQGQKDPEWDSHTTEESSRGRKETRRCHRKSADGLPEEILNKWQNLNSIIVIESERVLNGKTSVEIRYFISSCDKTAEEFLALIRSHWAIENTCHWSLDVTFQEDQSRVRKRNGVRNFALLRKLILSLLKQKQEKKQSLKSMRSKACMNTEYLEFLLQ